jgi:DNA-binding protein
MYLRYYSSVKISYGYKFCTIIDTERQIYFRLKAQDFKIVDAYISESKGNKSDLLEEDIYSTNKFLFDFLFEKEVIFYDDLNIVKYNNSTEKFKYYSRISNAIIEIDKEKDYKKLFSDLINLNCFYVEIRVSNDNVIDYVLQILNEFKNQFEEITIYFFEVKNDRFVNIINYAEENLSNIILVKRPNLEQKEIPENVILFGRDLSNKCCGEVLRNSFLVNRTFYNESVTYNNCLNLKVGIDVDGNIKNCPSMKESYGGLAPYKSD